MEVWKCLRNEPRTCFLIRLLNFLHCLEQGFPNWDACTPSGAFAYLKGYI